MALQFESSQQLGDILPPDEIEELMGLGSSSMNN